MPAARGVKRSASKATSASSASGPKNKKKRGAIQLEIPVAPKRRGRVLACGQGDVGQLGLGEDVMETTKFKFVSALGDNIVDICAGGMHSVALDADGKIWTFGCNDEGALGRATSEDTEEGTPTQVSLPAPAVRVTAGDSHSAALLHDGQVYAWGSFRDSHGSMGLVVQGRTGKACKEPVRVDTPEPAADIASGGDHLVILTTSGNIYTMGCGEQGQLGRLAQRSASRDARQGFSALLVPSKVTLRGGASRVWAGYHATFALDASGEKMLAWGLNNYGQLGISGEKRKVALYSPTECDMFAARAGGGDGGWRGVVAGQHHSLAVDARGACYAIGRCEYGRLGLGDRAGDAEALEPIPKLHGKTCVSIAAGTSNSYAVTDNGEVYAWGMGSEGQLGTGGAGDQLEPARVTPTTTLATTSTSTAQPSAVAAGGQHALLLIASTSDNEPSSKSTEKEAEVQKKEDKKEDKRPPAKKQKVEEEISSTSSAETAEVKDTTKSEQELNGNEEKVTPMEVDETVSDKPEVNKDDVKKDIDTTTAEVTDKPDTSIDKHTPTDKTDSAIDTTDSSQDSIDNTQTNKTTDSSDDIEKTSDVEMKDTEPEVNGSPDIEEKVPDKKPVTDESIVKDGVVTAS